MSNRALPMMPWYPDQFEASTVDWSFAEASLYRRLLDAQWQLGSLPALTERLARICKLSLEEFEPLWKVVSPKFSRAPGGRLLNKRLEYHRSAALARKEKYVKAGSSGGRASAKAMLKRRSSNRRASPPAIDHPPSPSPTPVEEHPQPPQGGRSGLTANGDGRRPREERDRSLTAWREIAAETDRIAATGSLPSDQRLTWSDVRTDDKAALRAAETVGFRAIADRDKFTTSDLQTRFREAYERAMHA